MITPDDIRNPSRKSGYDHVCPNRGSWRAQAYGAAGRVHSNGIQWWGPNRPTPLEAAQDYCDYINAKKPLTIEDIRNPKRKSGFDHVAITNQHRVMGGRTIKYQAQSGSRPSFPGQGQRANGIPMWRGPSRSTPEEAAQDYCDYVNGQRGSSTITALPSHGHTRTRKAKIEYTPEERAAQKLLREAAAKRKVEKGNFVYLVGEESDPSWVKIGEAYDPEDRYIGGQTFNPRTLVLLSYQKADQPRGADKVLHRKFAAHHHKAEWFTPADEILSHFNITKSEFLRRCGGTTKEVK